MTHDTFHDLETRSPVPIKNGTHAYLEQAEVMLWAYAGPEGEARVWDRMSNSDWFYDELSDDWFEFKLKPGCVPPALLAMLEDPDALWWFHNGGMFDFPVLGKHHPELLPPMARWRDTMILAYLCGLPGALEKLGAILEFDQADRKLADDGKRLIRLFCIPDKATGVYRDRSTHPEEWKQFVIYAARDIRTMRTVRQKLPKWNDTPKQWALWHCNLRINYRGFCVDQELATKSIEVASAAKRRMASRVSEITDGEVGAATQRDKLLAWILESYGVELPDLQADTLVRRIEDPELPPEVKELLSIRLRASMNSPAKFSTLLRAMSRDGRLRGTIQFRGAPRSGRNAHRLFQPGNMMRPTMPWPMIAACILGIKLDTLALIWDNDMEACSNAVRSAIVASPGHKLVVADLANVEGRYCAWLAGEEWKLQAFRDYDTVLGTDEQGKKIRKGLDLYVKSYMGSFGVDKLSDDKHEAFLQRQIGKVCLAEGSLVLTEQGLVPIEAVTRAMRVWDGIEWVRHQGVEYRGMKEVVTYDGITATPDHEVWIEGEEYPVHLAEAARRGSRLVQSGAGRQPVRVVDDYQRRASVHAGLVRSLRERAMYMRARSLGHARQLAQGGKHTVPSVRAAASGAEMAVTALCSRSATMHESEGSGLVSVRGPWHSVRVRFCALRSALHGARARLARAITGHRPSGQRWALCTGQSPMGHTTTERAQLIESQVSALESGRVAVRQEPGFASSPPRHDARGDHRGCLESCSRETQELARNARQARVYDIVNAGPRRRFTCDGKLVSNCELMFQYGGGVGAWITGAATYGIDLDAMTEAVFDTLPEDVVADAASYLSYLYEEQGAKHRKALLKLQGQVGVSISAEDYAARVSAIDAQLEIDKEKARFGLPEKVFITCDSIKRLWRGAHQRTASYWRELEDTIRAAIANPGTIYRARRVRIKRSGSWLRIALPSGRELCYPNIRINKAGKIAYTGQNQYSRRVEEITSYGAKFLENLTQAAANDQLIECQPLAEAEGYAIVLDVHDEDVADVPDTDAHSAQRLAEIMVSDLGWNRGCPLAAAGEEFYQYHKV